MVFSFFFFLKNTEILYLQESALTKEEILQVTVK